MRFVTALAALSCQFSPATLPSGGDDGAAPPDARADAPVGGDGAGPADAAADAGPLGAFGTPERVIELSSTMDRDDDPTLTADMLEIYFESDRESAIADIGDVFVSTRASVTATWTPPTRVAELSTPDHETSMEVSPDGLTLYVSSDRDGAGVDVYQSTRLSRAAPWTTPVLVTELSSSDSDYDATPTADPLVLYLASNRPPAGFDESDIWRFTRADAGAAWAVDELVVGASSASYETDPFLDASGTLWFTADIAGVDFDLYRALPNGDGSFGAAARVGELATAATESDAWLSPDGRTIYFTSSRDGTYDIFVARR